MEVKICNISSTFFSGKKFYIIRKPNLSWCQKIIFWFWIKKFFKKWACTNFFFHVFIYILQRTISCKRQFIHVKYNIRKYQTKTWTMQGCHHRTRSHYSGFFLNSKDFFKIIFTSVIINVNVHLILTSTNKQIFCYLSR